MESNFFITPAAWEHPEFNPFHTFLYTHVEAIHNHTSTMDEAEAAEARARMVDNLIGVIAHEMGVLIGLAADPAEVALEFFVEHATKAAKLAEGLKDALPPDLQ